MKCAFRSLAPAKLSYDTLEELMENMHKRRLQDHTILEFWTDSMANIDGHIDAHDTRDTIPLYTLSMGVWRTCDTFTVEAKYAASTLVLELLSEPKGKVDSAGGSYVLNLRLGLWTLGVIILVLVAVGVLVCTNKSLRSLFLLPEVVDKSA